MERAAARAAAASRAAAAGRLEVITLLAASRIPAEVINRLREQP